MGKSGVDGVELLLSVSERDRRGCVGGYIVSGAMLRMLLKPVATVEVEVSVGLDKGDACPGLAAVIVWIGLTGKFSWRLGEGLTRGGLTTGAAEELEALELEAAAAAELVAVSAAIFESIMVSMVSRIFCSMSMLTGAPDCPTKLSLSNRP